MKGIVSLGRKAGEQVIAKSSDKQDLVSGPGSAVRIWSVTSGKQVENTLHGHEAWVHAISASHECPLLPFGSYDDCLHHRIAGHVTNNADR